MIKKIATVENNLHIMFELEEWGSVKFGFLSSVSGFLLALPRRGGGGVTLPSREIGIVLIVERITLAGYLMFCHAATGRCTPGSIGVLHRAQTLLVITHLFLSCIR